ncbi:helix-turn-helix domain-containing protein [Dyadobacter sp. 32]|uniref:helix-turn-helix transcriptional regulator n=1 Tax=Dyadobacter sp. 32 TaxID=538966 RepID=UPI0011EF628F
MKLGCILRKLRTQHNFSQQEVADKVGVSQSTYFTWENDRTIPNIKCYFKLSSVFGVDIKDLIPRELIIETDLAKIDDN